jgi:hypothetical protein
MVGTTLLLVTLWLRPVRAPVTVQVRDWRTLLTRVGAGVSGPASTPCRGRS